MEKHQYDILERIFYDNGNSSSIYQRIGDKNQAIFDGTSSIDEVWQYRPTVITINGSQRLPNLIANVVDRFAINRTADFSVRGLRETDIKPHILRYSQRSIGNVIPFFMKRIEELIAQPENASFREKVKAIDANGVYQYPIGIMGWGTGVGRESEEAEDKIHICDYFPTYSRISKSVSTDSNILSDYFMLAEKSERHLGQIINRIMNAIVRILRLEKINTPDGKYYTTTKLINLLRCVDLEPSLNVFIELKTKLFIWSYQIVRGENLLALKDFIAFIPFLLGNFQSKVNGSKEFINAIPLENLDLASYPFKTNTVRANELVAEVSTIHSVKGQTQSASLYLETYYYKDGKGVNAKSYESQRLYRQFLGDPINEDAKQREKQSAKMVYVGFSRPTDLLCVAIRSDHYGQYLHDIDKNLWEVFDV